MTEFIVSVYEEGDVIGAEVKVSSGDTIESIEIVDAMTSKRAYRDTMPLDYAKNEMTRCSETQFDPNIVKAFLEVLEDEDKIKEIRNMK